MSNMVCPTFATSSAVTRETLKTLNSSAYAKSDYKPMITNFFNPVRHELSTMPKPSTSSVEFVIDVFDKSAEDLDALHGSSVYKQMSSDGYLSTMAFAVLDEQSATDSTAIIYYLHHLYDDESEEPTERVLDHWRVSFADAHELVGTIEACAIPVIQLYIIEAG